MLNCGECHSDDMQRKSHKRAALSPDYTCKTHGQYRRYAEYLSRLKNWCIVVTAVAIFPLTMILSTMNVSLAWVYTFMGVVIGSAVVPITLAISWTRCSAKGMLAGSILGSILAIVVWLVIAAIRHDGIRDFFADTGEEVTLVCGNLVAILGGGLICVIVSIMDSHKMDASSIAEVWENTRDIDNPLSPWPAMYARELNLTGVQHLDNRPSLEEVSKVFTSAKYIAFAGALVLTFLLVIVWPSCMTAIGVMSLRDFTHWVNFSKVLAWATTVFLIAVPLGCEVWEVYKRTVTKTEIILHNEKDPSKDKVLYRGGTKGQIAPDHEDNGTVKHKVKSEIFEFANLKKVNSTSKTSQKSSEDEGSFA